MGVSTSTKESTLHYFRDPLLDVITSDKDLYLTGIIITGTPQDNDSKFFAGERVAAWTEAMKLDGAIIAVEGWGNDTIDFANTIEQISKKDIPVAGLTFIGNEGLVVTNKYMDTLVDYNKSQSGYETGRVGENNIDELDAKKAVAYLKLKMRKTPGRP